MEEQSRCIIIVFFSPLFALCISCTRKESMHTNKISLLRHMFGKFILSIDGVSRTINRLLYSPPPSSPMAARDVYYIGVDVGTGSVRVSLVSQRGDIVASSVQQTQTWRDDTDHRIFEQSTKDIWSKTGIAIRSCLSQSGVGKEKIKGVGFDATCSLAVTDLQGNPVVVTKGDEIGSRGERNIVLWADHRAEKEADIINATDSLVLKYVGGKMSVRSDHTRSSHVLILHPTA